MAAEKRCSDKKNHGFHGWQIPNPLLPLGKAFYVCEGVWNDGVCDYEDCPYPVKVGDSDCGNHEDWVT